MQILYEDNHIISVVKPSGVLSQADGSNVPDMVNLLKEDIKERYEKPGNVFVGLVHRLDRNVGGTMVFAKTSKGASRLSAELRDKRFYKAYFALAQGLTSENEKVLVNYLYKDEKNNIVRQDKEKGKKSVLKVIRLAETKENGGRTLFLALPITGRAHQIRAQLSMAGMPLLGDGKYGKGLVGNDAADMGLWSCHVAVKHPVKDETMHFTSIPENKGVWSTFETSEYKKGAGISLERIKEWFTI
ncbi:MAG: RluA family pseudouridine synthase [Ruminococcaceae bacterium]|nr:RluA family pseudouridine synthase [Oscillospiraceae bacterium]